MSLRLAGAGGAVVLPADAGLVRGLTDCLFGWPMDFAPDLPSAEEALAVIASEVGGTFRLGSRHLDSPMTGLTTTSAVCAVIADLALGFCAALSDGIGLHCGAVRLGEGPLMLVAGTHRAGKSTLVARLALDDGAEVFCDDVLPINSEGEAIALGIAPRLRLPAVAALNGRIEPQLILGDDRYAYLRPKRPALHGTRARPVVLVALDRRPGNGPPCLHRMEKDVAIRLVLQQTLTSLRNTEAALLRAEALLAGMICVTLRYDDLNAAVALLAARFGAHRCENMGDFAPPVLAAQEQGGKVALPHVRLSRRRDVHIRNQESGVFLWHLDSPMLWHLNALGQKIWMLLETPQTPHAIAQLLSCAFAQVDPDLILADVTAFLGAAQQDGLVEPA